MCSAKWHTLTQTSVYMNITYVHINSCTSEDTSIHQMCILSYRHVFPGSCIFLYKYEYIYADMYEYMDVYVPATKSLQNAQPLRICPAADVFIARTS